MNVPRSIHKSNFSSKAINRLFKVKYLSTSDLNEIICLEPQIFPRGWSKALIESEFENPSSVRLGIFLEDILIGYSFSRIVEDEFNLLNIGIQESYRGMGLGQNLLKAVLDVAVDRKCSIAFLEVRESNSLAQIIYQKAGFQFTGKRPSYYTDNNESALLMELSFL